MRHSDATSVDATCVSKLDLFLQTARDWRTNMAVKLSRLRQKSKIFSELFQLFAQTRQYSRLEKG